MNGAESESSGPCGFCGKSTLLESDGKHFKYCPNCRTLKQRMEKQIEELEAVVASVVDYKMSSLFKEWQSYIESTKTSEQVDFFVYQQRAAIEALKGGVG